MQSFPIAPTLRPARYVLIELLGKATVCDVDELYYTIIRQVSVHASYVMSCHVMACDVM